VQLGKTHPQHQIHCQFPADFPNVVADEDRMRQLLSNLINNALKYAPAGEVIVSGTFDPAEVRVCVTDEGQGFNPEDIPHVFERFYRASGPSKTTKGTGLGLYLSKAIVDAHGGRIWIDESHKTGARICFSLPLRVENAVMKLP
jgi:signal transduction histidine kinase